MKVKQTTADIRLEDYYGSKKDWNLSDERIAEFRDRFLGIDYPKNIAINLGEYECSHRCRMCPQSSHPFTGTGRMITARTFELILDKIDPSRGVGIEISAYGETFLHPNATDLIITAKRRLPNSQITVATNGRFLESSIARRLLEAQIDAIQVSLNAGTTDSYRWFCQSDDYPLVVSNLETLATLKREIGTKTKLITHIIEVSQLQHEFIDFILRWREKVDNVYIRGYGNWGGMVDHNGLQGLHPIPSRRYPCVSLFYSMSVLSNASVHKCFLHCVPGADHHGQVGDLTHQTIGEIWQGSKLTEFRQMHYQGQYDVAPFCGPCISWAFFPNIWYSESSGNFS